MSASRTAMFNASTQAPIFPTTRHYTRSFADMSARDAATPDFVGQYAFQLDNSTVYRSDGTGVGEWASILTIETLTITTGFNSTGTTQIGGIRTAISTKTANYTVTLNDHSLLADCSGGTIEFELPDATTCAGQIFFFKRITAGGNDVNIDPSGSQTIDGNSTTLSLASQWDHLTIQSDGANWLIMSIFQA